MNIVFAVLYGTTLNMSIVVVYKLIKTFKSISTFNSTIETKVFTSILTFITIYSIDMSCMNLFEIVHNKTNLLGLLINFFITLGLFVFNELNIQEIKNDKPTVSQPIIVTHSGKFHTDEVFATALLLLINPNYKILRVPDKKYIPKNAEIVYDIGDTEFDHHNSTSYHNDPQETPYASFGLITDKYLPKLLKNKEYSSEDKSITIDKFISSLVIPVDANDNGVFNNSCISV